MVVAECAPQADTVISVHQGHIHGLRVGDESWRVRGTRCQGVGGRDGVNFFDF